MRKNLPQVLHNRTSRSAFGLGVALALLLGWNGASKAEPAAGGEMALLSKGKVVVSDAVKEEQTKGVSRVQAKIVIPRPPEQVWQVVTSPRELMSEEKKVEKVKTLSRSGNAQEVEYTVFLSPLLPKFNYTLRLESHHPDLVTFRRLRGSFKDFEGSWRMTPLESGKKTLLTYTLAIDPGFFAPRFLVLQAVKSDLPSMMKNVKTAIDKQLALKEKGAAR